MAFVVQSGTMLGAQLGVALPRESSSVALALLTWTSTVKVSRGTGLAR
jgi:hypothetical protein